MVDEMATAVIIDQEWFRTAKELSEQLEGQSGGASCSLFSMVRRMVLCDLRSTLGLLVLVVIVSGDSWNEIPPKDTPCPDSSRCEAGKRNLLCREEMELSKAVMDG